MTPAEAFLAERIILGIGISITSLEDVFHSRSLFSSGSVFAEENVRLFGRDIPLFDNAIYKVFNNQSTMRGFFVVRAMLGIAMCLPLAQALIAAALLTAMIAQLALVRRLRYGMDGSDQMTTLILAALTLGALFPAAMLQTQAFIALQLTLAYGTAGVAKFSSKTWRSGKGFRGVMSTALYGNRQISRIFDFHPALPVISSFTIYAGQVSIATLFVIGGGAAFVGVALATMFHFLVAFTMRLTSFLLAFGAGFPAVLLLSSECARVNVWQSVLH